MNVIKDIANSVDPMIKMTVDAPSCHNNNKVPMLGVEVWLEEYDNNKIYFNFYQKPERNRLVTMKSSALPQNQKMNILTQETFRRLYNTKEEIDSDTKTGILNKFMVDLKISGYNERERFNVLKAGLKTYENLREKKMVKEHFIDLPIITNMKESFQKKRKNITGLKRIMKHIQV